MSEGSAARLGHVPALDGLRGVAVAAVVAYHAFGWPRGGWIGVHLFFVLSGFLITTLLLEGRSRSLRDFYARRARRLLPALVALLLAYMAIAALRGGNGLGAVARYGAYTGNAYEAFRPGASERLDGLNHLWSLAQEEQFYLVWPALLLLVRKARRQARILVAAAIALMLYRLGLALAARRTPASTSRRTRTSTACCSARRWRSTGPRCGAGSSGSPSRSARSSAPSSRGRRCSTGSSCRSSSSPRPC